MHLKRRLTAVLALVCMTGAVIAGGRLKMAGDEKPTGLSVFHKKDTLYFWYTDDSMTDFFNSAAVSFGEKENVRVIPVLANDSEYLEAVNEASLHSGHIPDVYMISHDSLEKAYLAGLAAQIQDEDGICTSAHFPEAALSAVTYRGKLTAYPLSFETSALVYNETYLREWASQQAQKELEGSEAWDDEGSDGETDSIGDDTAFEDADASREDRQNMTQKELEDYYYTQAIPATVDDILNIGATFDVPEGIEGIMKWDVSDIFYNYWIVGSYMVVGGDAGDDEGNIRINNPQTVQCLEVYKALNQYFFIESDTVTFDSVVQDFIDGKTVFTIATTDVVQKLEQAKKEGSLLYDYGIALMPDVTDELSSRSLSVTNCIAVNGYSQNQKLANEFAAYLVNDLSDELYERTGTVSANLTADRDNGALQIFKEEYAESISLTKMISASNFWIQLEVLFSRVWNGGDVSGLVEELSNQILGQTMTG